MIITLLLLNSVIISQQQQVSIQLSYYNQPVVINSSPLYRQTCPLQTPTSRITICDNNISSTPGIWISNIEDDGGPSEEGTVYGISWEPNPSNLNYTIVLRELLPDPDNFHDTLMPVSQFIATCLIITIAM